MSGVLGRVRGLVAGHPHLTDAALAVVLVAVSLITAERERLAPGPVLATVVAFGALVLRHRWPVAVLVVAVVAAEGHLLHRPQEVLVLLAPLIALYTVADSTRGAHRQVMVVGLLVLALAGIHSLVIASDFGLQNLTLAALGGLALALGDSSRNRRAYVAEVEERARRAEAEREQEARRRVVEERLRLARELHDVLGHHIALINLQASVAARALVDPPPQAGEALGHIRAAGRMALDELAEVLGLLRQAGDVAAPVEPAVGLAGLAELLDVFRGTGLVIEHEVVGTARPIPLSADLTAYRVIQEALTNVSKHAGAVRVRLRLEYGPGMLMITVENDGSDRPPGAGTGHGLVGMRERVTVLAGKMTAGPASSGGFRVSVTLPLSRIGRA